MDNLVKVQCILESGYNDKDLGEYIEYNQEKPKRRRRTM